MLNLPKVFKETNEQIIIQQGRGLQILNDAATRRIIEAENYYKLFNGYKEPFLDSTKSSETYLLGTRFEEMRDIAGLEYDEERNYQAVKR